MRLIRCDYPGCHVATRQGTIHVNKVNGSITITDPAPPAYCTGHSLQMAIKKAEAERIAKEGK